jgi:hypothetical protein
MIEDFFLPSDETRHEANSASAMAHRGPSDGLGRGRVVGSKRRARMGRPSTGQVTERKWKDGRTITFGARLSAYQQRHRLVFGTNLQGWNRTRAEIELESILQKVERGTWVPPTKKTTVKQTSAARPDGHQLFGPFARSIVEAIKNRGLDAKTVEDLDWRLDYLVTELGRYELLEIDVERVDELRDSLAKRSQVIRTAEARGTPIMETVKQPGKNAYKRPKRPLSNSSINKILALLSRIMQRAAERRSSAICAAHTSISPDRASSSPMQRPPRAFARSR